MLHIYIYNAYIYRDRQTDRQTETETETERKRERKRVRDAYVKREKLG
jgi:hypothetical protein